ncbi:MAG: TonB-dependent receptor plug domain-containing protein [Chitinophagaceae bacterium]|nr:TonB-dependent receptor plug domain-containing protein [Chitinophagaceae bacterium]
MISSVVFEAREISVNNAEALNIDITPTTTLGQEVVVAATRTPQRILESPVTVERMSTSVLRNVPAPNYYEAINNLKGVDMHTASLTFRTVTTRGFIASGNTRLNQLIDGMDNQAPGLNFAVGSVVGLTELDVDNIELLAGASSALYGSGGINGTLLLTSKNPFRYQGLSFQIKQGIMHIDKRQRSSPAPYYDWSARYAKVFKEKFAIKLAGELIKGDDWRADDYRNKQQIGLLSHVVGGNRVTDPNYNGINVYGDEASANMTQFAQLVVARTNASVPFVTNANTYFNAIGNPQYPTNAEIQGFLSLYSAAPQEAQDAVKGALPFYLGVRNSYFQTSQSVSRTGYEEKYLVDYNTLNFKGTLGLHYKLAPGIEASFNSYLGTGTTVYTGADRYSLRNLKMAQHKLEVKSGSWFIRGYTTQENAGESYNASALGNFLNESWRTNGDWFAQYIGTFSEIRRQTGAAASDYTIHQQARAAADQGRLIPGTAAFESAKLKVRTTPIRQGGALFLDRSDLWASEGQLNLSDVMNFKDVVQVLVGAGWKQYVLNSRGTIFADTAGAIKINETGGYVQLKKGFLNDVLTLTGAVRYDKQTNFEGQFTPRVTATVRAAKDNFVRLSYQTAYRFPTNQDQYISLVTAAGTLIGLLPEFQTFYKLNSTLPGYTPASIIAYRASGNPANTSLLIQGTYREVQPETGKSYEVGYRGLISNKLFFDAYWYYTQYENFLALYALGQATAPPNGTGTSFDLFSPFTTTNISYIQNADAEVKSYGWGLSAEYELPRKFIVYGNVFSDKLKDVPTGFVSFFNAPGYRYNLGVRNDNAWKNLGFNVVWKWQDENFYEGTFVTGTLPAFGWLDGQVTYKIPSTKSMIRVGGTNLANKYYRQGFGSPYVGGLYYVSYGYNIF